MIMEFESTFYGRPNTIKTYTSLYRKHIRPGDCEPDWIKWDEESTQIMLAEWDRRGLSRSTKITLVRLLVRYVKFRGGPDIDGAKFIRALDRSEQQREVTTLTPAESSALMKQAKTAKPEFYPVLLLALHAGLRRGEIFGLRCRDVDILNGKIMVSHSYSGPTKSGKSRAVPMSAELAKALTGARNLLLRGPDEKVFEQFDPNPILRGLCRQVGISSEIVFHDLRHTFASLALTNGVNPKQVSTWLGHSSVVTTLSIYWNLTAEAANLDFLPD
jgi:integrase